MPRCRSFERLLDGGSCELHTATDFCCCLKDTSDAQESKKYIKLLDSFIETKRISTQRDYLKAQFTTEDSRSLTKERFRLREESFDDYPTKYSPEPISFNETGQTNLDRFTSTVIDTFEEVKTEEANSKTSEMFRFREASLDDRLTHNITGQDFFSGNDKSSRDVSTPIETHGILGLLREQQGDDVLNKYSDTFGHEAFLGGLFPMRMMPETTDLKKHAKVNGGDGVCATVARDRWVDQPLAAKQSVLIFYVVDTFSSCMAISPRMGQQLGRLEINFRVVCPYKE
uniref:Uncharacterized protein n=1 Tax=Timema bartmani TaxID=61472 RepID=A0A7R9I7C8_9NEOP|nr:unnamed protein product [Timema bartmani]